MNPNTPTEDVLDHEERSDEELINTLQNIQLQLHQFRLLNRVPNPSEKVKWRAIERFLCEILYQDLIQDSETVSNYLPDSIERVGWLYLDLCQYFIYLFDPMG